jgi:hypothetical protein
MWCDNGLESYSTEFRQMNLSRTSIRHPVYSTTCLYTMGHKETIVRKGSFLRIIDIDSLLLINGAFTCCDPEPRWQSGS